MRSGGPIKKQGFSPPDMDVLDCLYPEHESEINGKHQSHEKGHRVANVAAEPSDGEPGSEEEHVVAEDEQNVLIEHLDAPPESMAVRHAIVVEHRVEEVEDKQGLKLMVLVFSEYDWNRHEQNPPA